MALPFLVYAAFSSPPTRYLLPMLWGLSLAAAAVLARLPDRRAVWLAIPLALPGIFLSWEFQARNFGAADYLFGRLTKEDVPRPDDPGLPGGALRQHPASRRGDGGDFPGPVYFDRPWIVEGLINEAPLTMWLRDGRAPTGSCSGSTRTASGGSSPRPPSAAGRRSRY